MSQDAHPAEAPRTEDEFRARSVRRDDIAMGWGALKNLLAHAGDAPTAKLGPALDGSGMYDGRGVFRSLRDWLERLATALEANGLTRSCSVIPPVGEREADVGTKALIVKLRELAESGEGWIMDGEDAALVTEAADALEASLSSVPSGRTA